MVSATRNSAFETPDAVSIYVSRLPSSISINLEQCLEMQSLMLVYDRLSIPLIKRNETIASDQVSRTPGRIRFH